MTKWTWHHTKSNPYGTFYSFCLICKLDKNHSSFLHCFRAQLKRFLGNLYSGSIYLINIDINDDKLTVLSSRYVKEKYSEKYIIRQSMNQAAIAVHCIAIFIFVYNVVHQVRFLYQFIYYIYTISLANKMHSFFFYYLYFYCQGTAA